jgi:branched-chain amino acid transport system permease protein
VIEKVAYRPLRNSPQARTADHRHRHVHPAADAGHDHLEAQPKPYPTLLPSTPFDVGGAVITQPTQIMILSLTAVCWPC